MKHIWQSLKKFVRHAYIAKMQHSVVQDMRDTKFFMIEMGMEKPLKTLLIGCFSIRYTFYNTSTYMYHLIVSTHVTHPIFQDNEKATVFAHNSARFDTYFLLRELLKRGKRPKIMAAGGKIIQLKAGTTFIYNYPLLILRRSYFQERRSW